MISFVWLWWVDPDGGLDFRWLRRFVDEALRRFEECRVEGGLSGGIDGLGLSEVDLVRCHQANAGVMVLFVIPREESAAEAAGMLDGLEVLRG